MTGFEPATLRTQSGCASKLRHIPVGTIVVVTGQTWCMPISDSDDLIATIVATVGSREPACGRTRVLAIDGPSGSGKTVFAERIAERFGATVLHLEDLYRGWHGLESAPPAAAGILASIATDRIGRAPRWDWEHGITGTDLVIAATDLLVVEGVGAGARTIAPFTNLLIWLDGDESTRKDRALERDGEVYGPWWDTWARQEREHFAREGTATRAELHLRID